MADGAIVPQTPSPAAAKPKKAPEFGRPLDLPGDKNSGWTVSGIDRYGSVVLTRPSGQGMDKPKTISPEMYQRMLAAPMNQKKVFIKPKFKLEQPFFFDKGSVAPQAYDGHTNRTLVTGIVNGEAVHEWIDAKLLNGYFSNPDGARLAMAKRFGQTPSEEREVKIKKQEKISGGKKQTEVRTTPEPIATAAKPAVEKTNERPQRERHEEEEDDHVVLDTTPEPEEAKGPSESAPKKILAPLPPTLGETTKSSSTSAYDPRTVELRDKQRQDEEAFKNGKITKEEYNLRTESAREEIAYRESDPTDRVALSNEQRLAQLKEMRTSDARDVVSGKITKEEYRQKKQSLNNQIAHLEKDAQERIERNTRIDAIRQEKIARLKEVGARRQADVEAFSKGQMDQEEYGKRKRSLNDQIKHWQTEVETGSLKSNDERLAELHAQRYSDIKDFTEGKIDQKEYGKRKRSANDQIAYLSSQAGQGPSDLEEQTIREARMELKQKYEQRKQAAAAPPSPQETTITVQGEISSPPPIAAAPAGAVQSVLQADIQLTIHGQRVGFQKEHLVQAGQRQKQTLKQRLNTVDENKRTVTGQLGDLNKRMRDTQQTLSQAERQERPDQPSASDELRSTLQQYRDRRSALHQEQMNLSAQSVQTQQQLAGLDIALDYVQGAANPSAEMYEALVNQLPEPLLTEQANLIQQQRIQRTQEANELDPNQTPSTARVALGAPPVSERPVQDINDQEPSPMPQMLRPLPMMQDRGGSTNANDPSSSVTQDPYEQAMAHPEGTGSRPLLNAPQRRTPSTLTPSDSEQERMGFMEKQKEAARNAASLSAPPEEGVGNGSEMGGPDQSGQRNATMQQGDGSPQARGEKTNQNPPPETDAERMQKMLRANQQQQRENAGRQQRENKRLKQSPTLHHTKRNTDDEQRAKMWNGINAFDTAHGVFDGGGLLMTFVAMNLQMMNKFWPKIKQIPKSSIYSDLCTIILDFSILALLFILISAAVALAGAPIAAF